MIRLVVNILLIALAVITVNGFIDWLGPEDFAEAKDFLVGPYIDLWYQYRYMLRPDYSQPVWQAIIGIGALILLTAAPRLARLAAILYLGVYAAQVAGALAEMANLGPPTIDGHCIAAIAAGWLMLYRAIREPMFWVSVMYRLGG